MEFNIIALFVSALVPLLIGFIWYNDKVFGIAWMREAGLNKEDLSKGNMLKIFGFCYLFSLMINTVVQALAIHQGGAIAMIGGPGTDTSNLASYNAFMAEFGTAFRTYKHGALHGFGAGLFFAFPMIAINGLFERKSWKYIFIHSGYWILTLLVMGALICGWPK
jgi:hypothetical protein